MPEGPISGSASSEAAAVLFDFDGTLANTFQRARKVFPRLAREFRFPDPGPDALTALRDLPARRIFAELGIPWWKIPLVVWRARSLMAADPAPVEFFPGIPELLAELDGRGRRWGILTSNGHGFVRRALQEAGLPEPGWLEAGIGLSGKTSRLKQFLSAWDLRPDELVYVSDETRDLDAARRAGVGFEAVGWGYNTREALERAGARGVARDASELRRALLGESESAGGPEAEVHLRR